MDPLEYTNKAIPGASGLPGLTVADMKQLLKEIGIIPLNKRRNLYDQIKHEIEVGNLEINNKGSIIIASIKPQLPSIKKQRSPSSKKQKRPVVPIVYRSITDEQIIKLLQDIHPNLTIDDDAIQYIKYILAPYYDRISELETDNAIMDWLPKNIPKELARHAIANIIRKTSRLSSEDPQTRLLAITAVFEYLITELIEIAGKHTLRENRSTITTEDLKLIIIKDQDLNSLFNP
jgi:histone H3/H4